MSDAAMSAERPEPPAGPPPDRPDPSDGADAELLGLIDRLAGMFGAGMGLSADEAKQVLPIGPPAHVRGVVEAYAAAGVTSIIAMTQGPWKREVYQRMNDEVVAAFT